MVIRQPNPAETNGVWDQGKDGDMTKTEPHPDRQTDANPVLPHWQATVLTLFPDMFPGHLAHSLAGKSLNDGIWALKTLDIRDFARDKHRTVDDTPLGGGVGMV